MTTLNTFELLQLRYEWEEITRHFKGVRQHGTVDNLRHFLEVAPRKNLLPGCSKAVELATTILASTPAQPVVQD